MEARKPSEKPVELPKPDKHGWRKIDCIPGDGKYLCFWPAMKLDDEGDMTDEPAGGGLRGVAHLMQGQWDEPDALNAAGPHFDDDFAYSAEPTHWQFLPEEPDPSRD